MYRSGDELDKDLHSGDPHRVQAAIRELRDRIRDGNQIAIPSFGVEVLETFEGTVPHDIELDFINVIARYNSFVPQLSSHERQAALVALVLKTADRHVAFEVATKIKISPDPIVTLKVTMDEIVQQRLNSPSKIQGAKYLVSRLLDGKPEVRAATLTSLRNWPTDPPFQKILEYVAPQLDEHELAILRKELN